MKASQDESYWTRACRFFRSTGYSDSEGSYFLHNRNSKTVSIGVVSHLSVSVNDGRLSYRCDDQATTTSLPSDEPIFKHIERFLRKDAPCFVLVSPDLHRRFIDKSLPQIHLLQPALEFTFTPDVADGQVSYALDTAYEQRGHLLLQASAERLRSVQPRDFGEQRSFFESAVGWISAEDEESFLKRLSSAISDLQAYPSGKMTLTRAYERRMATKYDPFKLYELHAGMNGEYALSHFSCIRNDVFSLGVTPENVFEIRDNALTVDVVAATCKSSPSDTYLAKELYENPKQIKEHKSSLNSRQDRFRPFCKERSIRIVKDMHIKALRNVCHLHSVFTGELLPRVTFFDLLGNLFPLLGARPKELLAKADVERAPHRYYGGVVGHLHHGVGGCFLNIRNALLQGDVIHAKVGVGLIKESIPELELVETRDKLSGLFEAIHLWERSPARESGPDPRETNVSEG